MGWAEALLPYRAADDHQGFLGAALLAQDQYLFRLAAAWPRVEKTLPPEPAPGEEVDLEQVWRETKIDFNGWAELAQLNALAVVQGFKTLKGNCVIFPDGTLSHQAEALLKKEAAGKFMAQMNIKPGDLK
jgi:hypothetical protein